MTVASTIDSVRFRVPRAFSPGAILIVVLFCATATLLFAVDEIRKDNPLIWIPIAVNGIVAAVGLAWSGSRDGVSLRVVFWLYNLLFFGIAPLAQYLTGTWNFEPSEGTMATANLLILLSSFVYALSYKRGRTTHEWTSSLPWGPYRHFISRRRILVLLVVSGAIALSFGAAAGFNLASSSVITAFGGGYTPLSMLSEFTLRPFPFFVLLLTVYQAKYGPRTLSSCSLALLAGAFAFIILSPISAARFFIFAMYFGLYVILFPPVGKYRFVYVLLLYIGLFGSQLLPAFAAWVTNRTETIHQFDANYFYAGHFDGYENLCHSIAYVRDNGIVWGRQLLGAFLFWVPRSWWPTKPIGSAAYVATSYLSKSFNVTFTNIASPLLQEAYLNFGTIGTVVTFSIAGYFSGLCDARFQLYSRLAPAAFRNVRSLIPADHLPMMVLYPVILGLSLFILRGDFLSGFAFTSGIVTAFLIVYLFVRRKVRWAPAGGL
jgi:hypothetical protein